MLDNNKLEHELMVERRTMAERRLRERTTRQRRRQDDIEQAALKGPKKPYYNETVTDEERDYVN